MNPGLLIKEVLAGGLAASLGIEPGEHLRAVNGEPVRDFLDWNFSVAESTLTLELSKNGRVRRIKCSPGISPEWGLKFEEPRFRHCGNHCIFCFVDQLPPGARKPLCFKDEDFRLSFWHGNYITLTNLREQDFERIFRQRLSPLYISVHATDDKVRRFLLGNPQAPAILPLLRRLIEGKIALHAQVVICPGINDGKILDKTLQDLSSLVPGILSLAIIPVGLTKYRKDLYPLKRVTPGQAEKVLKQLHSWQKKYQKQIGSPWVYASDEMYLLARHPIPPAAFYGDYPQIENGVGLLRSFGELFTLSKKVLAGIRHLVPIRFSSKIALVTAELFAPHLQKAVASLPVKKGQVEVVAVKNCHLGPKVTVAGLLAGKDILKVLSKMTSIDKFFIPSVMLKDEEEIFLDDLSLEELRHKLGKPVEVISSTGAGLVEAVLREGGLIKNLT